MTLTDKEIAVQEAPYTPRYGFQGISDDRELSCPKSSASLDGGRPNCRAYSRLNCVGLS